MESAALTAASIVPARSPSILRPALVSERRLLRPSEASAARATSFLRSMRLSITVTVLGWTCSTSASSPGVIPGRSPTIRMTRRSRPVTPTVLFMRRDALSSA